VKPKFILVICAAVFTLFAGVVVLLIAYGVLFAAPKKLVNSLSDALGEIFQNKITVNVQNDTLGVKPIAELALADVRVRSIVDYKTVYLKSEKHMIAHESFDVKIGWDMKDDIKFVTHPASHSVAVSAKAPHILSIMHSEKSPAILLREDGMLNKLTPEDMIEVQKQLEDGARNDDAVKSALDTATMQFKQYFTGLFQMQNYTVTFDFADSKSKG
jgi:hypothetical protein